MKDIIKTILGKKNKITVQEETINESWKKLIKRINIQENIPPHHSSDEENLSTSSK